MTTASDTPCCPKCGGKNGYITDEAQVFNRVTLWDGEEAECEFVKTLWKHRNARCNDCGQRIRIPKAHKDNLV